MQRINLRSPVNSLQEMAAIERLMYQAERHGKVRTEALVSFRGNQYPIYSATLGRQDPKAPCLLIVGGVHGLEKIGTHVATALLSYTLEALKWDDSVSEMLKHLQLIFVPLLNPVGMHQGTRSNGNGVDLMRNAPIDSLAETRIPLVGGHRISSHLPWYRGSKDAPMEPESAALFNIIRRETIGRPITISLDIHSGFGAIDRIWFPFAYTRDPFPSLAEVFQVKMLLDRNLPNHVYRIEPQCLQYTTHGDLWDFFYQEHQKVAKQSIFLPFSLEIGSWIWVKKNPRQGFSLMGLFNPILPHRMARALRRHIPLYEFLLRLVRSYRNWLYFGAEKGELYSKEARSLWYEGVDRESA